MEFSRRHFDIFLSGYLVVLMHLQITGLAIEIPARAPLKRHGDHRLRRIKFDEFAVHVNPGSSTVRRSVFVTTLARCISNLRSSCPSTFSVPPMRYKTGRRIFPSGSGFISGTLSPLLTSCVMLYRHPVPSAVGINCPAQADARGAAASRKLTIFILRLGKCENSRSVNVV